MGSNLRFTIVVVLLLATRTVVRAHRDYDVLPPRPPLASFPNQLGPWHGSDVPISSDIRERLGKGEFLSRTYKKDLLEPDFVNLFVAYFPTQRVGDTAHSPANCLPGSGWFPLQADRMVLSADGQENYPVNRYFIAKGSDRGLVLYWYWAHGRAVASEYSAKFYLVADSIRLNRSDGALIRLFAPVPDGEALDSTQHKLEGFARELIPQLNSYVPR